jgi:hypothetical protein
MGVRGMGLLRPAINARRLRTTREVTLVTRLHFAEMAHVHLGGKPRSTKRRSGVVSDRLGGEPELLAAPCTGPLFFWPIAYRLSSSGRLW